MLQNQLILRLSFLLHSLHELWSQFHGSMTQRLSKESHTFLVWFISSYLSSIIMHKSEYLLLSKRIRPGNENMHLNASAYWLVIFSINNWAYVPFPCIWVLMFKVPSMWLKPTAPRPSTSLCILILNLLQF